MANLEKLKENNFTTNDRTNLFLDNDKFNLLRNNMLTSAQNLVFNPDAAILMQEQMNGTESSQLMIDMWAEYKTTTDNLKDFHVNVVDPSLIQVQNSINQTDEDIASELDAQEETFTSPFAFVLKSINQDLSTTEDYNLEDLKEKAKDYAANKEYLMGYMSYLNSIGSKNWTDEDFEAISIIMHNAIKNKDTELLNLAMTEFTYTTEVSREDAWGGDNVTYEIGVNQELMSNVLAHIDWKTQGRTYSTLSRISNMPSETVETAYYDDGRVRPGYEKPYINLGSCIEDGELKITIETNNSSYKFKTVNMYAKIGEEGYQNLIDMGMTDEEACEYANSIFTKEDIQLVQGLSQANTEDDYYAVAQINPDKLSDSGKIAFSMYSSQVFDNSYDYSGEQSVIENKDGIERLIAFSNGMFIKRDDGGHMQWDDNTGMNVWMTDSTSYGKEYYLLASSMASMQLEQSANMMNTYLNLDQQVTDEQLSEIADCLGISLEEAREQYEQNSSALLQSFNDIQQQNYDYLSYLAGLYNYDIDAQRDYILYGKTDIPLEQCEQEANDLAGLSLDSISFDIASNGRLSISYSGSKYSKLGYEDEVVTSMSSEMTGEQLDDIDRLNDYYEAVEEYKKKMLKAGFDVVGLVAEDYLAIGELGVAAISVLGALAQNDELAVIEAGSDAELDDKFDDWVASMVNGKTGTEFSSIPVASTCTTLAGNIGEILASSEAVDEAYFKLMREWNQDGIVVSGTTGSNNIVYSGAYDPETIYKWNAVKREGLSVMCESDNYVNSGVNTINNLSDATINACLSGDAWDGFSAEEKRDILMCLWTGDTSDTKISDLSNDQFIDAVNCLQETLPSSIKFDDTAVGDTFSERLSNWEAY